MTARLPRRRVPRAVAALVLAAALTASGCSSAVRGSGVQAPARGSDVRTANQLATLLVARPAGTTASTDPFDADPTPTLDAFSKGYYGTSGSDHLRGLGVTAVAHSAWEAGADAAQVVLFLFDTPARTAEWLTAETSALRDAGALPSTLEGVPDVTGLMFTQYGNGGRQDRRYYAARGRVGMAFDYFTAPHTGPGDSAAWVGAQYRALG